MLANISLSLIVMIGKMLSLHSHTAELLIQTNVKCIELTYWQRCIGKDSPQIQHINITEVTFC